MKLTEVKCNYCGRQIQQEFEEFAEVYHKFGYGTQLDGIGVEFDLCEDCLVLLFTSFQYLPNVPTSSWTFVEEQDSLDRVIEHYRSMANDTSSFIKAIGVAITVLSNINTLGRYDETIGQLELISSKIRLGAMD